MAADSAKIIDGKAFAGRLTAAVAVQVAALVAGPDVRPGLAVVLVGDNPASAVYVCNKGRQTWPPAWPRSSINCRRTPPRPRCSP